jgi:hypothetical protein
VRNVTGIEGFNQSFYLFGRLLEILPKIIYNKLQLMNTIQKLVQEVTIRMQAQPHPISGAMDFHQRFEFLRFHIDRHREQVAQLLGNMRS